MVTIVCEVASYRCCVFVGIVSLKLLSLEARHPPTPFVSTALDTMGQLKTSQGLAQSRSVRMIDVLSRLSHATRTHCLDTQIALA